MSSTIYAFANQKGGVGKTTTAVNLGAFLAWRGRRVLLIDLDPQGNASSSVGVDRFALPVSVYDVFMGETPLRAILAPSAIEHLVVAPSTPVLASAELELANTTEREFVLRRALYQVDYSVAPPLPSLRDEFDHILIDCPPSLGVLTVNALTAADFVIVPVQCEYLALEGLAQLMQTIALVRENLNHELTLFGLVMTMFDPRGRLAGQVIQEVRTHFPNEVFETLIPRNVRVAEAPSFGEPLVKYDIHSRGAEAYEKLTNEFLMREAKLAKRNWQFTDGTNLHDPSRVDEGAPAFGNEPSALSDSPSATGDSPFAIGGPPSTAESETL
ncbi:MAG: ParA family protein [Anaerolineae bacterium]|nr:ParA family protein [Anaerolineae bacterium]